MTEFAKRTHTCGQLRATDIGATVSLCGWVATTRDHGGTIFIDLRDRWGLTQIVFAQGQGDIHAVAESLRPEYVIAVTGHVRPRPDGSTNPKLATGAIEVAVDSVVLLAEAETPPFEVRDDSAAGETIRLKHRYIDLRRPSMTQNLLTRHRICQTIRQYYNALDFVEVETPFLTKSTPEGARDFLVPSRMEPGHFYALPQSPQLFKQILMIGGLDRYYQIVRCFRDEDLRANRQPEFTQLDVEMAFIDEDDIFRIHDGLTQALFKTVLDFDIPMPIPRITYADAMARYGCDAPDLRIPIVLRDVSALSARSGFKVFASAVESGGAVWGFTAPQAREKYSRKDIDGLTEVASQYGAKGLAWLRVEPDGALGGPIAKFIDAATGAELIEAMDAKPGDLMFFVADTLKVVRPALAELRVQVGKRLGLVEGEYRMTWVVDFPLLEYDDESGRYYAMHHPFTAPKTEDIPLLETDPGKARARAYDLVVNGAETGGGSIRIHNVDMQRRMFRLLGISPEEAQLKFGFLLDALKYGAPPHGGIAFGIDRMVMVFRKLDAIRDAIAFPKTQRGTCPLTDAPGPVDAAQLKELGLA